MFFIYTSLVRAFMIISGSNANYQLFKSQRYRVGDVVLMNDGTYNGWLKCNGAILNQSDYPVLYNTILNKYNNGCVIGNGQPWRQQYGINTTSGNLGSWSLETNTLPVALSSSHCVVTKNKVYLIGGYDDTNKITTNAIYTTQIDSSGNLGTWSQQGNIPSGVSGCQTVVLNNRVYLIASNNIYSCVVNSDGSLGSWVNLLMHSLGVGWFTTIVTYNRIYIVSGSGTSRIYYFNMYTDGSVGNLNLYSYLPQTIRESTFVLVGNKFYQISGTDINNTFLSSIYTTTINTDSTITNWLNIGNIPIATRYSQSVVTNSGIYVIGGANNINVYSSTINPDNSINTWLTYNQLPKAIGLAQVLITSSKIYVLGGYNYTNGGYVNTIYSAPFTGGLNDYSPYYSPAYQDPLVSSSQFRLPDLSSYKTKQGTSYFIKVN